MNGLLYLFSGDIIEVDPIDQFKQQKFSSSREKAEVPTQLPSPEAFHISWYMAAFILCSQSLLSICVSVLITSNHSDTHQSLLKDPTIFLRALTLKFGEGGYNSFPYIPYLQFFSLNTKSMASISSTKMEIVHAGQERSHRQAGTPIITATGLDDN